jgi:hypothetical protein
VILHAGCEDGFLNGCELVFKGISTDGRDYHTEMNSIIFEKWVNDSLVDNVNSFNQSFSLS